MKNFIRFATRGFLAAIVVLLIAFGSAPAQTTAFTYQGTLTEAGSPATGIFDLQFRLFDAAVAGTQVGATIIRDDVSVTSGEFTVTLDFGASAFPGANRFPEIGVRPGTSTGPFTALRPLQAITSTPYAVRSLNSTEADGLSVACVNCVTSSQIGSLPSGSGNYVQNTTTQQAGSNFNISGDGTAAGTLSANIVNTKTQYNLGGSRSLSNPGIGNLFAGVGSTGGSNVNGSNNTFFG